LREFIRHPVSVPFQLEELDGEDIHGITTLNNVSFGGISCISSAPIEKGKTVKMRIECINPDFEITGKAAWCRIKNDLFEIGIEFIVSKDAIFHLRMVEQICHIEHYRSEVLRNEGREINSEEAASEWVEKHASSFPAA
jgi:PilZ domain-containing protein